MTKTQRSNVQTSQINSTLEFYNNNYEDYFKSTVAVDMSSIRQVLTQKLEPKSILLDAGCGSGRDTKAFKEAGFIVFAFDASAKMAEIAQKYTGVPVDVHEFKDLRDISFYDGVFASASLLHLNDSELSTAVDRVFVSLAPGGWVVATFKKGAGTEVDSNGRFFNYQSESNIEAVFTSVGFSQIQTYVMSDTMGRQQDWIVLSAQKPKIE